MKIYKVLISIISFIFCFSISFDVNAKEISFEEFKNHFINNSSIINNIKERINSGEAITYSIEETDNSLSILINDSMPVKLTILYENGIISFKDDSIITSKNDDNAILITNFVNDIIENTGILYGYIENDINRFCTTDLTKYNLDNDGIYTEVKTFNYDGEAKVKPTLLKISLLNGYGGLVSTLVDSNEINETNNVKIENDNQSDKKTTTAIIALGGFVGLGILSAFKLKKED